MSDIGGYAKFKWAPEALSNFGLPTINYPVPQHVLPMILKSGGEVPIKYLMLWMMEYLATHTDDRQY